ncbi:hypothetical protein NIES2104_44080 [Leptolyngbya sp. NIES-2104]|nr:hypothetical protein NIES2104_44080 [Leptolyngbya sp. NIES-2104]
MVDAPVILLGRRIVKLTVRKLSISIRILPYFLDIDALFYTSLNM